MEKGELVYVVIRETYGIPAEIWEEVNEGPK